MIKQLKRLITLLAIGLASCSLAFAADTYQLDPTHSAVTWQISHFGFSNPSGKWYAKGTILLDEAKPENSKVDVTINVADITTGIKKLDDHLRSKDFFDIAKYPTATFVSKKIELTGQSSAAIEGMLTLHGVTKPVTLEVEMNKAGVSPISNKKTIGFTATTTLKRSDFGINKYLPGLSDEVKLAIEVEAFKA